MTIQPPATPSASSSSASSTSPRTELLTNLTTQTALLTQLFQSLSAPISTTAPTVSGTTFPTAAGTNPGANVPQLYAALQQSTSALECQTEALWAHQRAWREMKRQEAEVRDLEGRVRGLVWELESGRAELEGLVQEGAGVRATIERLESGALRVFWPQCCARPAKSWKRLIPAPIPVKTLLAHAHNLANYTSAPPAPAEGPSAPHLRKYTTPWPAETAMREGILYMEGGTMAPVGDAVPQEYGEVVHEQAALAAHAQYQDHGAGGEIEHDDWVEAAPTRSGGDGQVFDLDLNSDSDDE